MISGGELCPSNMVPIFVIVKSFPTSVRVPLRGAHSQWRNCVFEGLGTHMENIRFLLINKPQACTYPKQAFWTQSQDLGGWFKIVRLRPAYGAQGFSLSKHTFSHAFPYPHYYKKSASTSAYSLEVLTVPGDTLLLTQINNWSLNTCTNLKGRIVVYKRQYKIWSHKLSRE